jgi:hypothetical protein
VDAAVQTVVSSKHFDLQQFAVTLRPVLNPIRGINTKGCHHEED